MDNEVKKRDFTNRAMCDCPVCGSHHIKKGKA